MSTFAPAKLVLHKAHSTHQTCCAGEDEKGIPSESVTVAAAVFSPYRLSTRQAVQFVAICHWKKFSLGRRCKTRE